MQNERHAHTKKTICEIDCSPITSVHRHSSSRIYSKALATCGPWHRHCTRHHSQKASALYTSVRVVYVACLCVCGPHTRTYNQIAIAPEVIRWKSEDCIGSPTSGRRGYRSCTAHRRLPRQSRLPTRRRALIGAHYSRDVIPTQHMALNTSLCAAFSDFGVFCCRVQFCCQSGDSREHQLGIS